MVLRARFRDAQICRKCGAPAELVGREYERHIAGELVFDLEPEPVMFPWTRGASGHPRLVKHEDHGAVRVERKGRDDGERVRAGESFWAVPLTHLCTRNTITCEHPYECGLLPEHMTRSVAAEDMPEECHEVGQEVGTT